MSTTLKFDMPFPGLTKALLVAIVTLVLGCASNGLSESPSAGEIVVYWGQDSCDNKMSLAQACAADEIDTIIVSFLCAFPGTDNLPNLNVASHCQESCSPVSDDCCSTVGSDVTSCQAKGKKIQLSLGGAAPCPTYGFKDSNPQDFAQTVWNMFLSGSAGDLPQPFGKGVVFDGVDLDIEDNDPTGYAAFVEELQSLTKGDGSLTTSAPQCIYPDASMGPGTGTALSEAAEDFTGINVQFYNNPSCEWENGTLSTYQQWAEVGTGGVYIGLPASSGAAGSGYVKTGDIDSLVQWAQSQKDYRGFMLWDAHCNAANMTNGKTYSELLAAAMKPEKR